MLINSQENNLIAENKTECCKYNRSPFYSLLPGNPPKNEKAVKEYFFNRPGATTLAFSGMSF
jgi:hypothetical protein